jgi:uncharacterized membrane protein
MKDTGNQVVLGTFIATFIYCLLILGAVDTVIFNNNTSNPKFGSAPGHFTASHDAIPEKSDRKDVQERYQALLNHIEKSSRA